MRRDASQDFAQLLGPKRWDVAKDYCDRCEGMLKPGLQEPDDYRWVQADHASLPNDGDAGWQALGGIQIGIIGHDQHFDNTFGCDDRFEAVECNRS